MKEIPFWLASGPDMTGTAAGIGAARVAERRGMRARKVEVFIAVLEARGRLGYASVRGR